MATTPQQRIQIKRRDSAPASAEGWAYLLDGELGYIKDENGLYIGLGSGNSAVKVNVTSWDQLEDKPSNIISQIYLNSTDPTKIVYKKVGSNTEHTLGNFAPLTNGLIDLKYLPQGALERLVVVANATARLKLTTANVQLGDTVKETDTGLMYVVVDESKLNSEDGYQVYVAGRAAAVDWTGVENKVNATASSAGLMSAADKKKLDNTNIAYGTCTTAANVAAKVITVSGNTGWKLAAGSMISIFFSYTNTAQNPTFNVNGTGAKNVYYNQSQITTSSLSYAGYTNRICNYIYDGTQFRFHSWGYDANTNTQVRVYRNSTSSYNEDYPLIASRTLAADLGTVGTQDSNEAVYGLISDTAANIPTINPYSGAVKVKSLSATGNISTSDGNVSGKLLHTTAATNLNAVSDKVAVIKSGGQISYRTPTQIISDAGVTATVTELNYVDGTTSNIQTQLNSKAVAEDAVYFNQTGTVGAVRSNFTNLIPSSIDLNGNIYNNIGYKPNTRWSSSGNTETSYNGMCLSGYMPCKKGDVLRLKNIEVGTYSPYILLFNSLTRIPFKLISSFPQPDQLGVYTFTLSDDVAYFRISVGVIDSTSIATINEGVISDEYLGGWLKEFDNTLISPNTWISQVFDLDGTPYKNHTHNYAGSSNPGGAANSANKLNTDAGSATQPIYFKNGVPVATTYALNETVPSDAVFTDKKVQQSAAITTAGEYPVLLGYSTATTAVTNTVNKAAAFTYNPNTKILTAETFKGKLTGNADTATKLKTARTISLTGDVSGSVSFDGSSNVSITTTVANDSHTHTTGVSWNDRKLTVTAGGTSAEASIPTTLTGFTSITSTNFVGNASTATKLANKRKINGTDFDGSADITTSKWGTARTISINSAAGTTGTSVDGSANATLVVPATMTGFTSITSGTLNANTVSVNSNSAEDNRGLIVTRSGSTAESVRIGVNDSQAQFIYTNNEISSSFLFTMANTGTESNNTANANTANVTFTGADGKSTVIADTFKGALTGNADTATILKNARTLTIGNTSKTFNGSANVSWTLAEIGAVAKAGDIMTGFLTLHANPTANLHAATKQYVDDQLSKAGGGVVIYRVKEV